MGIPYADLTSICCTQPRLGVVSCSVPLTTPVVFCDMVNVVGPTAMTTVLSGMFVPVTRIPTPMPAVPEATVTLTTGLPEDAVELTRSRGAGDGDQSIWRLS